MPVSNCSCIHLGVTNSDRLIKQRRGSSAPALFRVHGRYWTWLSQFFLWGSILLWFVFVIIYTAVKPGFTGHLDDKDNIYGIVTYAA
jgi:hypothetical protein